MNRISLNLCDIIDGYCHKCNQAMPTQDACPDFRGEVSKYNDDNEHDYSREDNLDLDSILDFNESSS